jgi:protein SCO1
MKREMMILMATCLAMPPAVFAHSEHGQAGSGLQKEAAADVAQKKSGAPDARAYFTDLELTTQDGKKVRFYSDVLQGRTVVINTIYTNCKDACPLITQKLNEVRAQIPESFGKEVFFVSISSDPVRDTPEALKTFAQKQNADAAGWVFLTGKKENIVHILKKLGQFSEDIEDHSTLLIAGNVPQKRWSKIRPDAPPVAIAERIKLLVSGPFAPAQPASN